MTLSFKYSKFQRTMMFIGFLTFSFLIVYDYNEYKNDTTIQYLTPQIKHKSEFISSIKINPSQIEFLIQK